MPEKDNGAGKLALGVSTAAAVAAAIALLQRAKTSGAEPPEGVIQLPQELWDLIIAIAGSMVAIDTDLDKVITAIEAITLEGGLGWPANANSITSLRVAVPIAGIQLPYISIPSGMALFIKAWPINPGWLQVGASIAECTNINQSFPLIPSETVWYQVQNADEIYIAATAVGCFACLTVEQKRGGGS